MFDNAKVLLIFVTNNSYLNYFQFCTTFGAGQAYFFTGKQVPHGNAKSLGHLFKRADSSVTAQCFCKTNGRNTNFRGQFFLGYASLLT